MAYYDQVFYVNAGDQSTTGYYAVAKRPQNAAVTAGQLVRQFTAPAVGSERVFVCIIAGTTSSSTDATWVLTRGAKTTDGTATWMECTGIAALNSDITNTVNWTAARAIGTPSLGTIIKRNNGTSYQICTTAGTLGAAEPAFSDTAGVTTTETSATTVWTSLGAVANFTKGAAPHARFTNAYAATWFASGNTIYIGNNHAETASDISQNNASSPAMSSMICHNHSGNYPPAAGDITTGASVTVSNTYTANGAGAFYFYGITFATSNLPIHFRAAFPGSTPAAGNSYYYDNCSFLAVTGNIEIGNGSGSTASFTTWNNCTVKFGNTSGTLPVSNGSFIWQNTGQVLVVGSSIPNTLLTLSGSIDLVVLEALDLSQLTGNVFSGSVPGSCVVKDCKLNASTVIGSPTGVGLVVQSIRADGGATAYKSSRYAYEGTETTETSITRVGGASDPTGQAQSRKIVTTANSQWLRPFKAEPYAMWNPRTAANVTVTVCGTVNSGTLPNNDDIWMDVEYLGSSATPLGTIVNTTKANLYAANAAVASDSSTWNGGGSGAGWSPFKLVATLSAPQPGMAGYIHVRPRVAKPSAVYYIDPQITLS